MDEKNLRLLPVLDEAQKCRGLLSLFKLSKFLFPAVSLNPGQEHHSREVLSSLAGLARTLDGQTPGGLRHRTRTGIDPDDRRDGTGILRGAAGKISAGKILRHRRRPLGHPERRHSRGRARAHRHRRHRGGSQDPRGRAQEQRQRHHLAARHGHHRVALPRRRGRAPRVERGISLLPRKCAAGRRARGGHVLRLPGLSRAGQRRRNRGHSVQDRLPENGHAQIDSGGPQRTVAGRAGRGRGGNH